MRIYSDTLAAADLQDTARQVHGLYIADIADIPNPRTRQRGWTIATASTTRNRKKNSGNHGASRTYAASYDDHGHWFALLYKIDPNAKIAHYNDAHDFHTKTQNKYKPHAPTLADPGTGSVSMQRNDQ